MNRPQFARPGGQGNEGQGNETFSRAYSPDRHSPDPADPELLMQERGGLFRWLVFHALALLCRIF